MTRANQQLITDSAWFWVLAFSFVGLALLGVLAVSGQYSKRQARLDRQYQARERVAENAINDPGRREYATPDSTLVPVWPLAVLLAGVAIGAAVMLQRERSRLATVASIGVAPPTETS